MDAYTADVLIRVRFTLETLASEAEESGLWWEYERFQQLCGDLDATLMPEAERVARERSAA